jgi:GntR family transcriptional regulator
MNALVSALSSVRFATPKPLYAQVRDMLLVRVKRGEWTAGECLPNEFMLSAEFNVSIGTVRRAVAELEASGVLLRKQGRGTYVAGAGPAALQQKLSCLRLPGGDRLTPAYTLVSILRRAAASGEAKHLGIGNGGLAVEVVQTLAHGDSRIGVEVSVLCAASLPRLETQLHFGQNLYPVLADYGMLVTRVEETIGLEIADGAVGAHLGIEAGVSLLAVERVAITLDGQIAELRSARYLPGIVRYAGMPTSA